MIVKYEFADGTVSEVAVSDDIGREIAEIEAEERRIHERSMGVNFRYYDKTKKKYKKIGRTVLFSEIDSAIINGALLSDGADIPGDYEKKETDDALHEAYTAAIKELEPQQRELLNKLYTQRIKAREIAKEAGVTEAAISQRVKRIHNKLKARIPNYT